MPLVPNAAAAMPINGQTRLVAIVGDPVAHVRSPDIYNPRMAADGHNAVLVPVHLPAGHFEVGMRGLMSIANVAGLVVTYPFKERAMSLVDNVGLVASRVGAINAMRREQNGSWTGDVFDGAGLLAALRGLGQAAAGRKVTLLGAGGAGSAIAMSLADAQAASIRVFDRAAQRAESLASRVVRHYPSCEVTVGAPTVNERDLLINATPVGMAPEFALAPFAGALHPGLTVIDIVPQPAQTMLLERAQAAGCRHANGQAMIAGQADAVLGFFDLGPIGHDPATRAVRRRDGRRGAR
jgi:shikimate dehydrogenase